MLGSLGGLGGWLGGRGLKGGMEDVQWEEEKLGAREGGKAGDGEPGPGVGRKDTEGMDALG